jgi:hypothetical protein
MSDTRKVLYINHTEVIKQKMDAIAAFIIGMTPSHPLFPQPLRPSRMADIEAGQYNLLELCECCSRLLALHITGGLVSDDDLRALAQEVDVLREAPILAIPGNVLPSHMADLTTIYTHLGTLGDIAYSTRRGSVNLKFPLMVAILYAYQRVQIEG